MNYEDVQKLSNAAKNKIGLLNGNFLKYFLRAVMAGFFIDVAVIYSNVIGSVFSGSDPAWGKFLGAVVFSIAVLDRKSTRLNSSHPSSSRMPSSA